MDSKIIDKITEEIWGKWESTPIAVIIFILLGIFLGFNPAEKNYKNYIIAAAIIGLCIWYFIFVYNRNHIRKAKKGSIGILFYYDCANREIYNETVRKFGEEFRQKAPEKFDIIPIQYGIDVKKYQGKEKTAMLLKQKNCTLYLHIKVDSDSDNNSIMYELQLKDGTIIHGRFTEEMESLFKTELVNTLQRFKDITFSSLKMTKSMKFTAIEMSISCEYIIGISLFLSGKFKDADSVLNGLYNNLAEKSQWNNMRLSINNVRYQMFIILSSACIERFQSLYEDTKILDRMNNYLESAQKCCENTYDYFLAKAYYCIARNGDLKKAQEYINRCKQVKGAPKTWMYSDAFLKAYENKSVGSICAAYKKALAIDYNVIEIIAFTEAIYKRNPERYGLLLEIGIMYNHLDDRALSKKSLDTYLTFVDEPQKVKALLVKRKIYL